MTHTNEKTAAQTFILFLGCFATIFLLCGLGLDAGLWYLDRERLSRACDSAVITGVSNFGAGTAIAASKMRDIAAVNYYAFKNVTNSTSTVINNGAAVGKDYIYTYTDPTSSQSSALTITLSTGVQGQITRAKIGATTTTHTAFMGFTGIKALTVLNTGASAEAQRRPRLIVLVLDRSGSMGSNGGSGILPGAVTNFLGMMKSDAENNTVGIVSFSSFVRVEMPLTTNFWNTGTNVMKKNLVFGGGTCADDGMRQALEMMRSDPGFIDPRTVKYIVFFTDGQFNSSRTLWAAPTITNTLYIPAGQLTYSGSTNDLLPIYSNTNAFASVSYPGAPYEFKNTTSVKNGKYNVYVAIKMIPGSMNIWFHGATSATTNWSSTLSTTITNILGAGDSNLLISPGYILDGAVYNIAGHSAKTISTNVSVNNYFVFKPEDSSSYYPGGLFYSTNSDSTYTNMAICGSYMAGELFYNCYNSSTQEMTNPSEWLRGAPDWILNTFTNVMTQVITANGDSRYYAKEFNGEAKPVNWVEESGSMLPTNNTRGGIKMSTSQTNINAMSWNGGPTHFYDFSRAKWMPVTNWTDENAHLVPLGNWKVETYSDQARRQGVVVYTVGFSQADPTVLRHMANDPNSTTFNPNQPQGGFYPCTKASDITTAFGQIAQQILAFLTQ